MKFWWQKPRKRRIRVRKGIAERISDLEINLQDLSIQVAMLFTIIQKAAENDKKKKRIFVK